MSAGADAREEARVDVLVAGHYCHDLLQLPDGSEARALGGSAAYVSRVLAAAGVEHRVAACVGEDFRYASEVLHPARVRGPHTTEFAADLRGGERALRLTRAAPPLLPSDLEVDARVGLACGVAGEVTPEALARLLQRCERVLADAQALLRVRGADGRVELRRLEGTAYAPLLAQVHVLKASEDEARLLDLEALRARGLWVVVTRGARGCTVLEGPHAWEVPALPVREVDPTGAGDCFLAGFALGLLRGRSARGCAELARWFGAQAVTQVGLPRLEPAELARQLQSG